MLQNTQFCHSWNLESINIVKNFDTRAEFEKSLQLESCLWLFLEWTWRYQNFLVRVSLICSGISKIDINEASIYRSINRNSIYDFQKILSVYIHLFLARVESMCRRTFSKVKRGALNQWFINGASKNDFWEILLHISNDLIKSSPHNATHMRCASPALLLDYSVQKG